ncbi:MAG: WD40 repeat domain-containing protein [Armatimonadetes bacterium]|nr:WD40 repeat domain-containing protein [Armatimonadota bacterium]
MGNIGRLAVWPPSVGDFPVSPYNVAFTPDGKVVAYSVGDSIAVDHPAGKGTRWESPPLGRSVTSVVVSGDGKLAVGGCMNGAVTFVDLENRKIAGAQAVPGEVRCLALGSDGRTLAVGCGDGMTEVAVVDALAAELLGTVKPGYGNTWAVAISPDTQILATGSDDRKIRLWKIY